MPIDARTHTQIFARLWDLTTRLAAFEDVAADLRDNQVFVVGARLDRITCAPRPDDGGRLWFFDSTREPIIEADHTTDAALLISGKVRAVPDGC